jgi:hypothetical protein
MAYSVRALFVSAPVQESERDRECDKTLRCLIYRQPETVYSEELEERSRKTANRDTERRPHLMRISLDQAIPHIVQHGLLCLELARIKRVNISKRQAEKEPEI